VVEIALILLFGERTVNHKENRLYLPFADIMAAALWLAGERGGSVN